MSCGGRSGVRLLVFLPPLRLRTPRRVYSRLSTDPPSLPNGRLNINVRLRLNGTVVVVIEFDSRD